MLFCFITIWWFLYFIKLSIFFGTLERFQVLLYSQKFKIRVFLEINLSITVKVVYIGNNLLPICFYYYLCVYLLLISIHKFPKKIIHYAQLSAYYQKHNIFETVTKSVNYLIILSLTKLNLWVYNKRNLNVNIIAKFHSKLGTCM